MCPFCMQFQHLVLQTFAAWAQTQHGIIINALRSDRGGEYTGREFTKFLQQEGTKRRLTTHDTPQHNGVAESMLSATNLHQGIAETV